MQAPRKCYSSFMRETRSKSTYDVWQGWAKALQQQLKLVDSVYADNKEEGAEIVAILERLRLFIDPVANASELAQQNYDVKGSLAKLYLLALNMLEGVFRDTLRILPQVSEDMQRLLDSPPLGICKGRLASDIFKGPHGTENFGIGRGVSDEAGYIAHALAKLLDELEIGGEPYLREGLAGADAVDAETGPTGGNQATRHDFAPPRRRITATGVQ
jgi:hypothetical protein